MKKLEIKKLIDETLTKKEKEFYKNYIRYMSEHNYFEFVFYLKNKNKFFTQIEI